MHACLHFQSSGAQTSGQRIIKVWTDQVKKKKNLSWKIYVEGEKDREREREGSRGRERESEKEREGGRERVNNMLCYGGSAEVIKGRS